MASATPATTRTFPRAAGWRSTCRRKSTFPGQALTPDDAAQIIKDLLAVLTRGGLVEVVLQPKKDDEVPGYQLQAGCMRWVAGDGTQAHWDPIRVPNLPADGGKRTNPFFVEFYRETAAECQGIHAHEHTAQVPYETGRRARRRSATGACPCCTARRPWSSASTSPSSTP